MTETLLRRLGGQAGIALPMVIGMMLIFTISVGAVIAYSSGSQHDTDAQKKGQAAHHAAEAALATAISTLASASDPRVATVLPPCSAPVEVDPGPPLTQTLTLTLPAGCRRPVGETAGSNSLWCTVSVSTYRFQLYRKVGGGCDNTGKKYADYLTQGTFIVPSTNPSTELKTLSVTFPVDPNSSATTPNIYRLSDDIVLRNTVRS